MRRYAPLIACVVLLLGVVVYHSPIAATPDDPEPAPGFTIPTSAAAAGQALKARLALLQREYSQAVTQLNAGSLADPSALQQSVDRLRKDNAAELLVAGAPNDVAGWRKLLDHYRKNERADDALGAAWNLHQLAKTPADRASALLLMADLYAERGDVDTALNLAALAIAAEPAKRTRDAYAALRTRLRLSVTSTELDVERDLPRLCLVVSRPLAPRQSVPLADLISVRPATDVHVTASGRNVCISGLAHGRRYDITLHAGLLTADGVALDRAVQQSVALPDRTPRVRFASGAYVLARSGRGLLPLRTVNLDEVPLRLYRVPERNAVPALLAGTLGTDLAAWDRDRVRDEFGELVWQGVLEVRGERNRETVTNLPIGEVIAGLKGEDDPENSSGVGIYALAAPLDGAPDWTAAATQWLVVSNIGVGTLAAQDALHVFTRALDTAKPQGGVTVRLLARNNSVLAEVRSDGSGYARLPVGVLRGRGGNAPAMLTTALRGDFNYVSFNGAALDLSERGAEGRPLPGPVDAWLYTDRGVYRPGETVQLAGLVRDPRAKALANVPLRIRVTRPGDILVSETAIRSDELGSLALPIPLASAALTGQWQVRAYVDPDAPPVGSVGFLVEDFVPPRLELATSSDVPRAAPGARVRVAVDARYYYGAPGSALTTQGKARIEVDPQPFAKFARFHFGRVDSEFRPLTVDLAATETDANGRAVLDLAVPAQLDRRVPLRANVLASVFDTGGRPVNAGLAIPLVLHPRYVGVAPRFAADSVPAGSAAGFDLLAVDAAGTPTPNSDLRVEWVREEVDYVWFNENGAWNYREQITEYPAGVEDLRTAANGLARIDRTLPDGRYRIDLYDRRGNASASYRFYSGWWNAGTGSSAPDALTVTVADADLAAGETISAFIRAPFAGRAQVLVANEKVFERLEVDLPAAGKQIELRARAEWSPGAYLLVTAWRPELGKPSPAPARAMGLAWLAIDRTTRELTVTLSAPERASPRAPLVVPVSVAGARGKVGLTLAAVDEGVLALTRFASPDPTAWFLGQRMFFPDVRDLYGQLIAPSDGVLGTLRVGGDMVSENLAGLDRRSSRVVALFSRVIALDASGRANVRLDVPDWNGRLRLMAVAWSADRVGRAEAAVTVRDPVVTDLLLPRFLAPGDRASATIDLRNPDPTPRTVALTLASEGSVDATFAAQTITLPAGGARRVDVPLVATAPGEARMRLVARVGDNTLERSFDLAVRPGAPVLAERSRRLIAPGASERLDAGLLERFYPTPLRASLLLASGPAIDATATLEELLAYPYGCTEQMLSSALPRLYLARDDVADTNAVRAALANTLARQRSDGSFGAWTVLGDATPWLTAYAYDVLARGRERGYDVPFAALELSAAALRRSLDDDSADPRAGAYAAYALARENAIKPAEVRRYVLAREDKTTTRLELAHLAAATALIGDRAGALRLFDAAVRKSRGEGAYDDYGSDLRDATAMLTLLGEVAPDAARAAQLAELVDDALARHTHASTQELAWLTVAAARLQANAAPLIVRANGRALTSPAAGSPQRLLLQPTPAELRAGYTLTNAGGGPVRLQLTVRGALRGAPPAESEGYEIARSYHDPNNGNPIDARQLRQGQLVLVVIRGASKRDSALQKVLIADLLPAGLEIENAALSTTGELGIVPVIGRPSATDFVTARDDRYVAALTLGPRARFQLAYLARAVTPGTYHRPGIAIEDMVQPRFRARGAADTLSVTAMRQNAARAWANPRAVAQASATPRPAAPVRR